MKGIKGLRFSMKSMKSKVHDRGDIHVKNKKKKKEEGEEVGEKMFEI